MVNKMGIECRPRLVIVSLCVVEFRGRTLEDREFKLLRGAHVIVKGYPSSHMPIAHAKSDLGR